MPKEKPTSQAIRRAVAAYFAALSPPVRRALRTLEKRVHAAAPQAEQGFSYRMPCVRLEARPVVWYGGFKAHVSLFPMTAPVVKAHEKALSGLSMSKGTIRFPLDELPSPSLVKKLVTSRLIAMSEPRPKKKAK
jgi:uncharacterized protein YdhG (YjbR/CyaY superfamily)